MDDAILYLLHRPYSHLERLTSMVGVMVVDFSGEFNTTHALLLQEKLGAMKTDNTMVSRIMDRSMDKLQSVHLQRSMSDLTPPHSWAGEAWGGQ